MSYISFRVEPIFVENQVFGWREWFSWLRFELECLKRASVGEKLENEAESAQFLPNPQKSAQICFGEICPKRCAARFDAEPCRHCAEIFFLRPILAKTDFSEMHPNSCFLARQQMCCLARPQVCCLARQQACCLAQQQVLSMSHKKCDFIHLSI